MSVGPLRYEILEPMREARVVLDDNESGISCDLTFTALTASIRESQLVFWSGARRVRDSSRFAQLGRWRGEIRHPDGTVVVDEAACRATKDRSWGVRAVGEPEGGAPPLAHAGVYFVWAPLFWDDHVTHALIYEDDQGRTLQREGFAAPLYPEPSAIQGLEDSRGEHTADVRARIRYLAGTRYVASAELDMVDAAGLTRTILCEPILRFMMKGLGYGHPVWGHGLWRGELAIGHESFVPEALDPLARENLHTQHVVRIRDGRREGVGALEHICVGPNVRAGFRRHDDGAAG